MKNKTELSNIKNNQSISLFIQFVLLVSIIILAICCLFLPVLEISLQVLVVLLLLIMSYNNYKIFKRKGFTTLYAVAGVALLAVTIVGYIYER